MTAEQTASVATPRASLDATAGETGARRRRRLGVRAAFVATAAAGMFALAAPATPAAAADGDPWWWDTSATTMCHAALSMGTQFAWTHGWTGKGVGVALIDTGVSRVPGLTSANVIDGPDLSFESQDTAKRYVDRYTHGTHLAGIIAGRANPNNCGAGATDTFTGIAPDVKLTSVKVGIHNGAVDVTQVLAAIDWVVAHRNDDPANPIRVINLAYGTDGIQDYKVDPLAHAVENAWKAGIVVVVAGGNDGATGKLVNPAYDPYVITVGALDINNTYSSSRTDDRVAEFTTRGNSTRKVDVLAPGRSVVSLRVPGSNVDNAHPSARVGTAYFKGSGSSQAAAMVSGTVAWMLQANPSLTPDKVKWVLKAGAGSLPNETGFDAGLPAVYCIGMLKYLTSSGSQQIVPVPSAATQTWTRSAGTGVLEKARGTQHLVDGSNQLTGEKDIFGSSFDVRAWATASANKSSWSGGTWMGRNLAGTGWSTVDGAKRWSGRYWAGTTWSGRYWSSSTWTAVGWLGQEWS